MFPFPGRSHYIMFRSLLKGLAQKGHDVDVVSHFPLKENITGYNDISIRGSAPIFTNNFTLDLIQDLSYNEILDIIFRMSGTDICKLNFATKELQELKKSKKKYDVVLTEHFSTDCMLGWAWHFGAPSIVMTSSENFPWASERFALPDNPSYIPTYFVEYGSKMNLYQRIVNAWTLLKGKLYFYLYSSIPSTNIAREFFGDELPDLNLLAYNTSLHLVNTHFSISNSRPLVPNVVEVAGLHIEDVKPLDEHFSKILETDTKGVIYFSMGSLVLTETYPPHILQAIFDALAEVPYKVLWKGTREKFPKGLTFPSNIHFEPWIPQLDILCDPRVKLFVSHGGMMGTQEGVYCGVPILGIPLFADQSLNIKRAETAGYGIRIDLKDISKKTFSAALRKILFNPRYTEIAKETSELFKDRIASPLDMSIYWVEYVIRHKGAVKLQSAAKDLHWYQYYFLDVIAIILATTYALFYLVSVLSKLTLRKPSKIKIKSS